MLEWAQIGEIEDRAEVDVEAVGALAGEHLHAVGQGVHRRFAEGRVVWRRARADVARRTRQVGAQHPCVQLRAVVLVRSMRRPVCGRVVTVDAGHRIELPLVPVGAAQ